MPRFCRNVRDGKIPIKTADFPLCIYREGLIVSGLFKPGLLDGDLLYGVSLLILLCFHHY